MENSNATSNDDFQSFSTESLKARLNELRRYL